MAYQRTCRIGVAVSLRTACSCFPCDALQRCRLQEQEVSNRALMKEKEELQATVSQLRARIAEGMAVVMQEE